MDGRMRWGNVVTGARRWWVPGVVAVVLAALVVVPTIIATNGNKTDHLNDGSTIAFGRSRITVGSGWELSRTATDLERRVVLQRGSFVVRADQVTFPRTVSVEEAWAGFERLVTAKGGDLGVPTPFATLSGDKAWAAPVAVDDRTGTAFLVPADDGSSAVEGTALGPAAAETDHVEALEVIGSITVNGRAK